MRHGGGETRHSKLAAVDLGAFSSAFALLH